MKNIVLLGAPRSGKSTFAKMVYDEFPNCNVISEEIYYMAYMNSFEFKEYETDEICISSRVIDNDFYRRLIKNIVQYANKYVSSFRYIIDSSVFNIDKIKNLKNSIVIVFGYPDIDLDEKFKSIRENDTELDWTYNESDERLKFLLKDFINMSKTYKKQCLKNNIKFVNVSKNQKKVLDDLLIWLKENID